MLKKTKLMIFSHPTPIVNVYLNGTLIVPSNSFSLLGVKIDNRLSFTDHIAHVINKLNTCIYILRKYITSIPAHALKLIFNSLALMYIDYCVVCYHDFLSQKLINKLTSKYNMCAKLLLGIPAHARVRLASPHFSILGWLPLHDRVLYLKLVFIHSIFTNYAPAAFDNILIKPTHTHATRFSNYNFEIRRAKKNVGTKCLSYWGPRTANDYYTIISSAVNNNTLKHTAYNYLMLRNT